MWFSLVLARGKRALIQPVALFQILGQTGRSQAINFRSEIPEPIKIREHPRICFLSNDYTGFGEIFRAYA